MLVELGIHVSIFPSLRIENLTHSTIILLFLEDFLKLFVVLSNSVCKFGRPLSHQKLPLSPLVVLLTEDSSKLLIHSHLG